MYWHNVQKPNQNNMEKECFSCKNTSRSIVPAAWHPDAPPGESYCAPCFAHKWPGERPVAFAVSAVLAKWLAEHFAPTHTLMDASGQRVFALPSQLDAHHVGQMSGYTPKMAKAMLEKMARDYRVSGALALMSTQEWFDQMVPWYVISLSNT